MHTTPEYSLTAFVRVLVDFAFFATFFSPSARFVYHARLRLPYLKHKGGHFGGGVRFW